MAYTVTRTSIDGVLILEPQVFGDERGFFMESFNQSQFETATGLKRTFVQDNHSRSVQGVLRGLHYQTQHVQAKLVRVTRGSVFDVVVDLRKDSRTHGQWYGVELSAANNKQIWVPEGMAHGFLTLSDEAESQYKTTDYYHPEYERSLLWNDVQVGIDWPLDRLNVPLILSNKDGNALPFSEV